jgi:hypothetical protein
MPSSRVTVAFVLLACSGAAGLLAACSDTDPHYGSPDAIRGRVIDYGTPAMTSTPTPEGGTTTTLTPQQAFAKVYASVNGTCGSCHLAGTGGAAKFFGADEAASYTSFKAAGYDKANSAFYTKPAGHPGPALSAAQKTLMDTWIAAEAKGGGGTPAPADAGGD